MADFLNTIIPNVMTKPDELWESFGQTVYMVIVSGAISMVFGLFFIMCLLLNYICLFPVFSVFAARTDQILFIDTGQILSAAASGYVVFPVLI